VPVIDGAGDCRKDRVDLDLRIAQRYDRLQVARVVRLDEAAQEVDLCSEWTIGEADYDRGEPAAEARLRSASARSRSQ
jgi:hypothetical protein